MMSPKLGRFTQIKIPKLSNEIIRKEFCTAPKLFATTWQSGSGQNLGVNTHLNSASTHVVTGKNMFYQAPPKEWEEDTTHSEPL